MPGRKKSKPELGDLLDKEKNAITQFMERLHKEDERLHKHRTTPSDSQEKVSITRRRDRIATAQNSLSYALIAVDHIAEYARALEDCYQKMREPDSGTSYRDVRPDIERYRALLQNSLSNMYTDVNLADYVLADIEELESGGRPRSKFRLLDNADNVRKLAQSVFKQYAPRGRTPFGRSREKKWVKKHVPKTLALLSLAAAAGAVLGSNGISTTGKFISTESRVGSFVLLIIAIALIIFVVVKYERKKMALKTSKNKSKPKKKA